MASGDIRSIIVECRSHCGLMAGYGGMLVYDSESGNNLPRFQQELQQPMSRWADLLFSTEDRGPAMAIFMRELHELSHKYGIIINDIPDCPAIQLTAIHPTDNTLIRKMDIYVGEHRENWDHPKVEVSGWRKKTWGEKLRSSFEFNSTENCVSNNYTSTRKPKHAPHSFESSKYGLTRRY